MKVARKLMMVLLCVVLVIGITSCAGTQTTAPSNGPTEKVHLTYSMWGLEAERISTQAVVDKFNDSQDRIEVEVITIPWETYVERLNTMATANQLPDAGIMSEKSVIAYAEMGLLQDISTMYAAGDPKPMDTLAFKFEGKTVAYSVANEILLLYYNKDMFDAAGVDYPSTSADNAWTWDQFIDTAKKLTLDNTGKTPNDAGFDKNNIVQYGCMVENLAWQLEAWCLSNGGGFFDESGKMIIGNEASMEAIQKVADLYLNNCVAPLSTGLTDDGVPRSLVAGTCAMTTNGAWNIGTCLAEARDDNGLNYGIAVLPFMKEKVTINAGGPNVVFSQTKHPAEAMEFMKWYAREENNWDNLIATGIWMPTLESYYNDAALTEKWLKNPNFPPFEDAKAVLVDYAKEYTTSTCWYYAKNQAEFEDLLSSVLGDVWTGKISAKDAITNNLDALQAVYEGNG